MKIPLALLVSLCITKPSDSSFADARMAQGLIDMLLPKRELVKTSNALLDRYLRLFPERSLIVSPITVDDLPEGGELVYYSYTRYCLNILREFEGSVAQGRYTEATAALHVLNIFNKIQKQHSAWQSPDVSFYDQDMKAPDVTIAQRNAAETFLLFQVNYWFDSADNKVSLSALKEPMQVLSEMGIVFVFHKWNKDEKLKLIPRIAHDLAEYMTLTSHILKVRDPAPVVAILRKLQSLVFAPLESCEGPLRDAIGDIYRKVHSIRSDAILSPELHESHDSVLQKILMSLSAIPHN